MSSTLPRTRSLGRGDTRSLTRDYKRNNIYRPSSLCDNKVHGIAPLSPELQDRILRSPSQAVNLATTVPTCIVNKNLGRRHAPTRSSLRHSRMALMARTVGGNNLLRSHNKRYRRISAFVAASVVLVGLIDVLLALWLLHWVPALAFAEVPHLPGTAIIVSGILSLIAFQFELREKFCCRKFLQTLVVLSLLVSCISCLTVCIFDIVRLVRLAPMECCMKNDVIFHSRTAESTTENLLLDFNATAEPLSFSDYVSDAAEVNTTTPSDDVDEGSGMVTDVYSDDEDLLPVNERLEVETVTLDSVEARINEGVFVNESVCVCYNKENGWEVGKEYPRLSCEEVKNHVPIFLVASCILMVTGAVLSVVLIYLMRTIHKYVYDYCTPQIKSELKPFINRNSIRSMDKLAVNPVLTMNGYSTYR